MNERELDQIQLRLEHLGDELAQDLTAAHKELYANHAARGLLQSGATVKLAFKINKEHADRFLSDAVSQVGEVVKDAAAFDLLTAHLDANFDLFEGHIRNAVTLASGGKLADPLKSVVDYAEQHFSNFRKEMLRKTEIERFNFLKPSDSKADPLIPSPNATALEPVKKNVGGKPLADHWDAMWATVAVKLWQGDIAPKSQADVKAAMFDWFNKAGIEIGDTALTKRARRLWQAMQDG